jgi:hypothetical protein
MQQLAFLFLILEVSASIFYPVADYSNPSRQAREGATFSFSTTHPTSSHNWARGSTPQYEIRIHKVSATNVETGFHQWKL